MNDEDPQHRTVGAWQFAIAAKTQRLAILTLEDPVVEKALGKLGLGAWAWARHNRADVATAALDWYAKNDHAFVVSFYARPGEYAVHVNQLASKAETQSRFFRENPRAIEAAGALAEWLRRSAARNEIVIEPAQLKNTWSPAGQIVCAIEPIELLQRAS